MVAAPARATTMAATKPASKREGVLTSITASLRSRIALRRDLVDAPRKHSVRLTAGFTPAPTASFRHFSLYRFSQARVSCPAAAGVAEPVDARASKVRSRKRV